MAITIDRTEPAAAATPRPAEDGELVARLLAGDEAAFTGLVQQYHGSLVRLAQAYVSTREAAEEVAQDTWLAVLKGLQAFEGRSALKTWIFSILTNRAKSRGQRDKRWSPLSLAGVDDEPSVDPSRFAPNGSWAHAPQRWRESTPEDLLLQGEVLTVIEDATADLPPAQRAALTLRDVEGLSSADVCNILEVSETNQRVLLHRARTRVRAAVEEYLRKA